MIDIPSFWSFLDSSYINLLNEYNLLCSSLLASSSMQKTLRKAEEVNSAVQVIYDPLIHLKDKLKLLNDKELLNLLDICNKNQEALEKIEETNTIINNWDILSQKGWSIPPGIKLKYFISIPSDTLSIDSWMEDLCANINFGDMLKEVQSTLKDVSEECYSFLCDALQEANNNFMNGMYISTCMVLFSVIDSVLINLQEETKTNRRPSGKRASEALLKDLEEKVSPKTSLYIHILRNCADSYYGDAKDFKRAGEVLNRNCLLHGMLKRKVNITDCKKLFLYLYNLLYVVDSIFIN